MKIKHFILVILHCFFICLPLKAEVSLAFVGDILLAGQAGFLMKKYGTTYPFEKTAPILKKADLAFGNLECALTGEVITHNVPLNKKRTLFIFKVPPKYGQALVDGGIDVVSLANNHSMNGGKKGLIEMMDTLKKLGIVYVGAGRNYQESRSLRIIETKGVRVGFLAYSDLNPTIATKNQPGIASAKNLNLVLEEVKTARKKVDILVVSFHWGIEGSSEPTIRQKDVAHSVVDAGADIVIGHHPHVLQPIEIYKEKTIAYSLGNFVFDNPRPIYCKTMILVVVIKDGKQKIEQIPCFIKNAQPTIISQN